MYKQRLTAIFLALIICFSTLLTAYADEAEDETDTEATAVTYSEDSDIAVSADEEINSIVSDIISEAASNTKSDTSDTDTDTESDTDFEPIPDYYGNDDYDTAGNLSLITERKIIYDSAEMQFIAVTTKDGHVFYILIDYTAIEAAENGEEGADARDTVYFLNKVDDYDLYSLIYESDTDGSSTAVYNYETITSTESTDESNADNASEPVTSESTSSSGSSLGFFITLIVAVVVVGGGYYFIKIRGGKKQDIPDDDDEFEFEDTEINEDEE